jgi:Uracil DNA glycosylase superfamily
MASTIGKKYTDFICDLKCLPALPSNINYLDPYKDKEVQSLVARFFTKYFDDNNSRVLVLGINPGRFGGGQTGIAFTDPVVLQDYCGINNVIPKRRELSSTYIYDFIDKFGGAGSFYDQFLISSICPLGFIRDGKNLNFYDDKLLLAATKKFIENSFRSHIEMGFAADVIIVFGKKNTEYFNELNKKKKYFKKVITLEHPRYIMQYKRKLLPQYIDKWMDVFNNCTQNL